MMRILAIAISLASGLAAAAPLEGEKTVYLEDAAGARIAVADIAFNKKGGGADYAITMRETPFMDHFLSMRPFKCLEGAEKHWCHVPYPYEIKRTVSGDDRIRPVCPL